MKMHIILYFCIPVFSVFEKADVIWMEKVKVDEANI